MTLQITDDENFESQPRCNLTCTCGNVRLHTLRSARICIGRCRKYS